MAGVSGSELLISYIEGTAYVAEGPVLKLSISAHNRFPARICVTGYLYVARAFLLYVEGKSHMHCRVMKKSRGRRP